jgi:Rieske Fe-S protein
VGSAVAAKDGAGRPVLVAQPSQGKVVAFTAICTHQGCTVAPAGTKFQCPCHGSMYEAATGAVLKGPAARPLTPVPVHVAGGNVVTD